ncbi:unnamed protein product [Clonostachys rhizophaga]|uniref:Uncharacterized protein n=1 Tax=Clonostachys rhizophaga TaxID=160324 RepID=A0A9N9V284_9HYPO|nr:unnamed protein product [Clonostachys rhizophaga]
MANVAAGRQVVRCSRWEHSTGWTEDEALAGYEDIAGQYSIIDVQIRTTHALSLIFVGPASVVPVTVPFPLLDAARRTSRARRFRLRTAPTRSPSTIQSPFRAIYAPSPTPRQPPSSGSFSSSLQLGT